VGARNYYQQPTYQHIGNEPKIEVKRRWRFKWKPGSILLVLALGYVLFSFGQVYYKTYQLMDTKAMLAQQLQLLQQENRILADKYDLMQSDSYIEKLAREDLGLVKPGETVVVPALPGDVKLFKETESNQDIRD